MTNQIEEAMLVAKENHDAVRQTEYENRRDEDEEFLTRETPEQQSLRNELFIALQATRGEPGMAIKKLADLISTVFSREEVQSLRNELQNNLDA